MVDSAKAGGTPMTFAMTFPPGTHAMDPLLARSRRHPPRPRRQPDHHPAGPDDLQHAGWEDGRVLRQRAVERPRRGRRIGFTAINTGHLERPPEKVCVHRRVRGEEPKTVKAVLKALHEASVWLDDLNNRPEQAEIVSRRDINCPKN